jgi:alpha-ketoglutarate-dependent taurine dioxygenase
VQREANADRKPLAADAFGAHTRVEGARAPDRPALPLVVSSRDPELALTAVIGERRALLTDALDRYGAVLMRGFRVGGVDGFEAVCESTGGRLMEYRDRATPRSVVAGRVLTATDYPANVAICLHNENVFAARFPQRLFFHCMQPAAEGGQTPLADVRRVYARIPLDVRDEFERRGVLYLRRFGGRFGLDWRDAFQTDDRGALERYLAAAAIEWEWQGDVLRTRQRRPAVAAHPRTHERSWLNHAVTLHVSSLEPGKRRMLLKMFGERDLPNNVFYGDDAAIEDEVIEIVRAAYETEAVALDWELGDVLIVDNLSVAHGRRPFRGGRRLVVAMADPIDWSGLAVAAPGSSTKTDRT